MRLLEGKVAIITGGGSGIGKAVASIFLKENCLVVIAGRDEERLHGAAKVLGKKGSVLMAVPTDVTDPAQVKALFQRTMERFGRLDLLVNSAGAFGGNRIDEIPDEMWNRVISTSLTGLFFVPAKLSGL